MATTKVTSRAWLKVRPSCIVLAVGAILFGLFASIGFRENTVADSLEAFREELHLFVGVNARNPKVNARFHVDSVNLDQSLNPQEVYFQVLAEPAVEFQKHVFASNTRTPGAPSRHLAGPSPPVSEVEPAYVEISAEDECDFLRRKLIAHNVIPRTIVPIGRDSAGVRFGITAALAHPLALPRAHHVTFCFSLCDVDLPYFSAAGIILFLQFGLSWTMGVVGVGIGVVCWTKSMSSTWSARTHAIELGARWGLLRAYAVALGQFSLYTGFLLCGSWAVLAARSGHWSPEVLLVVPLVVLRFAFLLAVALLICALTRNGAIAIVGALCVWLVLSSPLGPPNFRNGLHGATTDHVVLEGTERVVVPNVSSVGSAMKCTLVRANGITKEHLTRSAPGFFLEDAVAWGSIMGMAIWAVLLPCVVQLLAHRMKGSVSEQ